MSSEKTTTGRKRAGGYNHREGLTERDVYRIMRAADRRATLVAKGGETMHARSDRLTRLEDVLNDLVHQMTWEGDQEARQTLGWRMFRLQSMLRLEARRYPSILDYRAAQKERGH